MKRTIRFLLILGAVAYAHAAVQPFADDFNIIMEPAWKDLDQDEEQVKKFGGKWILAGTITFKKKAQDKVHLERLYLKWDGEKIDNLIASLYTSESHEDFLPIQENLICDGNWNNVQQKLIFNFDEKQLLTFKNCYFLVLTVRDEIEPVLKNGKFDLVTTILPEPFKECLQNGQLCLRYNFPAPLFANQVRVAKR
jgi:hypothetical protein